MILLWNMNHTDGWLRKKSENEGMPALSEKGVFGDPTKADAKRGQVYLERTVDFLVKEIKKQLKAG